MPARVQNLGTGDYGACLRFDKSRGLLVTAQNPFLAFQRDGGDFSLSYKPEMPWEPSRDSSNPIAACSRPMSYPAMFSRRRCARNGSSSPAEAKPGMDEAEVDAFTNLVRAFLLYKPPIR